MDQRTPAKYENSDGMECSSSVLEQPTLYLKDLCRICAEKRDVMVPVFGEEGKNLQLQLKINQCLPIKVQERDLLPLSLCQYCVSILDQSHSLFNTCQQTDLTFRRMLVHQSSALQEANLEPCSKTVDIADIKIEISSSSSPDHVVNNSRSCSPCSSSGDIPSQTSGFIIPKLESPLSNQWCDSNANIPSSRKTTRKRKVSTKPTRKSATECILPVRVNSKASSNKKTEKTASPGYNKSPGSSKSLVHKSPHASKKKCKPLKSNKKSYKKNPKRSVLKHCEECVEDFVTFRGYSKHMLECHQIYACEVHSDFKGSSYAEFQAHKKDCTTYLCSICGKNYTTKGHLDYHLRTHGEKEVHCKVCDKYFYHENELKRHKIVHEEELNFCCHECPKRFRRREGLTLHLSTTHCKDWTYHCAMCDKECAAEHEIEEHCSQHSQEDKLEIGNYHLFIRKSQFYCQICDKYYATLVNLHYHMKKYHAFTIARQFKCDFCQKLFLKKSPLQEHMSVHLKLKRYPCKLCPKSFHTPGTLEEHLLAHVNCSTVSLPYNCTQCDKTFESKSGLSNHIKSIHLNVKPHSCSECGRRFYRSSDLQVHLNSHSGMRPYPCTLCSKSFKSKKNLGSHMKTHSDERPFQCQFCEKAYKGKNDKKRHEEKFHALELQ